VAECRRQAFMLKRPK